MSQELANFVIQEARTIPHDRMVTNNHDGIWLRCPIHSGGMESTPSAKINTDVTAPAPIGFFYCFGCHNKMPWNDFAILFGLKQFTKGMVREANASYYKMDAKGDPLPPDFKQFAKWPDTVPWRNIPGSVVKKLKGRSVKFGRQSRLYIPVTVYGENMGGIYCALEGAKSETDKSYINSDGEWSGKSLMGYDLARKMTGPLAIVEGQRDVGWMLTNGWRVVGLIGSKVSDEKIRLIQDLDPPSILDATDPDDAGDHASEQLSDALSSMIPMRKLPMRRSKKTGKKKEDPADLPAEKLIKARKAMVHLFGE